MGVPRGTARLLLDEHRQRPFSGSLLQLGRSSIYFTRAELEDWARRHRVALRADVPTRLSHDPRLARQGCIDDQTFFRLLGFDEVRSCDVADWEHADYLVDLNQPLPAELAGRFDAVFETGTIIQVFDVPQVLANVHAALRPGGRAIHAGVPSSNHVDLGFYMFSPTLFHDFYLANRWRIESSFLCEYQPYWHRGRLHAPPWRIHVYDPAAVARLSYGGFGRAQLALFVTATRLAESTGDVVPQLGQYRESWREFAGAAGELAAGARASASDDFFARHPLLDRWYPRLKPLKRKLERFARRRLPKPIARY